MLEIQENMNNIINNIHMKHKNFYNRFKIIKDLFYINEIDNLKKKDNDNNNDIKKLFYYLFLQIVIILFGLIIIK